MKKATKSLNLRMTDELWKELKTLIGKESGSQLNGFYIENQGGKLILRK